MIGVVSLKSQSGDMLIRVKVRMEGWVLGSAPRLSSLIRPHRLQPALRHAGELESTFVQSPGDAYETQGKGKTPKEILKKIDYGGITAILAWVCV